MNGLEILLPTCGATIGFIIAYQSQKTFDYKKAVAVDRVVRSANLLAVSTVAALVLLAVLWAGAIYCWKASL